MKMRQTALLTPISEGANSHQSTVPPTAPNPWRTIQYERGCLNVAYWRPGLTLIRREGNGVSKLGAFR